jgi:tryptophanase
MPTRGPRFLQIGPGSEKVFGFEYTLPVHQGRAAEHLLVKVFLKPSQVVLTNYHFPSTRVHVEIAGSQILDLVGEEA